MRGLPAFDYCKLYLGENFFCGDYRVGVDRDGVFHVLGIAAGVGDHHGNISRIGYAEDQLISLL